jgi:hypothetical protein
MGHEDLLGYHYCYTVTYRFYIVVSRRDRQMDHHDHGITDARYVVSTLSGGPQESEDAAHGCPGKLIRARDSGVLPLWMMIFSTLRRSETYKAF